MVITKQIVDGAPADNAEIVEAATFEDRLDIASAGIICLFQRLEDLGENIRAYDIKQAFTYASGTWELILDNDRDTCLCFIKIIVTSNVGAQLRIIHDFGSVSVVGGAETTFTATGVAEQALTATERLAVVIANNQDGVRCQIGVRNFSVSCDSRLLTPDEAVAGLTRHVPPLNTSLRI